MTKDPNLASEQRKDMSYQEALSINYNETMAEVIRLYKEGHSEDARRLIGRCCAAAAIRLQHEN